MLTFIIEMNFVGNRIKTQMKSFWMQTNSWHQIMSKIADNEKIATLYKHTK